MNLNSLVNNYTMINRMKQNNFEINKSMSRLSSGKRVNTASDSPSDILRINRFNSQIRGSQMAQRNIQDGLSFLQSRETAVDEMISITQRIKELSTQYKNDTLNSDDKKSIEFEASELLKNINHIKENTKFNGLNVFEYKDITIQTGANSSDISNIKKSEFCINPNKDGTFNFYNWEKVVHQNEVNTSNLNDFSSIYLPNDATITKKSVKDMNSSFSLTCEDSGRTTSMDLKFEKEDYNTDNSFDIKGTWITSSKAYDVTGTAQYDEKTKTFNGVWNMSNGSSFNFSAKVDKLDDIKNLHNIQVQHSSNEPLTDHPVNVSNFKISNEEKPISIDEFKDLIKKTIEGTEIKINYQNRDSINLSTKDGKTTFETSNHESVLRTFNIQDVLKNTDLIDGNLMNPLIEHKNYIGIKTNELESKYNLEQAQETNNINALNKIEDVDMAKEMMNKVKNQMLLNINAQLFSENLENHKSYIAQLLR